MTSNLALVTTVASVQVAIGDSEYAKLGRADREQVDRAIPPAHPIILKITRLPNAPIPLLKPANERFLRGVSLWLLQRLRH